MNIRTHFQALLICTMALSAQGQSIVDSQSSLPRSVQLRGDDGRETVRPDESKRISPNEAPASRIQPQRIVNRIAATVNGRPITANEVSVRLMPIGAQLAAQYPKQGPEFYKQLALAKKNIIEDLVERELLRNEFEGMGGVIRDSLIDQEVNRTILTTFNECDMSAVMELRKQFNAKYREQYGTKLGFMSFFIKAVVKALQEVPQVNAKIDGTDIVENLYYDISIAIGTDKGLVVPVLRDCDRKTLPELELELASLAEKVRNGSLSMQDLQGGCFTISNGGTYGSLLSTPILNPPQSGILGMHAIQERPVVRDGQIVARPMMYLALSYDHRLVDGKQAVQFLIAVKNAVENPVFEL